MDVVTTVIVVEDVIASEHKTMHTKFINEHFSEFNSLLTHHWVVYYHVDLFNLGRALYFRLDQELSALRVDPKFVILKYYLLETSFR